MLCLLDVFSVWVSVFDGDPERCYLAPHRVHWLCILMRDYRPHLLFDVKLDLIPDLADRTKIGLVIVRTKNGVE